MEKVGRGLYQLTAAGTQLLADAPARIDVKFLNNTYPAHATWHQAPLSKPDPSPTGADDAVTPEEALDRAAAKIRCALEADLLERVRPPPRVSRTRGGGPTDRHGLWRRRRRARPGDGGIDGTIREDALGLDEVYLQAKKYAAGTTVSEVDLRNFAGAIDATNTTKGVFVTTAGFTRSATDYVAKSPKGTVKLTDLVPNQRLGKSLSC